MKKQLLSLATVLLLTFTTGCIMSAAIQTPQSNITHYKLSKEEVKQNIIDAATLRGWTVKTINDSTLQANILVRNKHSITVNIPYTTSSYSIEYVSSSNLDAKSGTIHPNYNKWVYLLSEDINRHLAAAKAEK